MSTSRLSGNQKVAEEYSSDDEELEPIVQKVKNNLSVSRHKIQDKHKKDQIKDSKDKRSSQKQNKSDESSSDEALNRRHKRGSKKSKVNADRENYILYDRTETQVEKYQQYSDSSDNEKRHSKRETQKSKCQRKDRISNYDRLDERCEQKRIHRHDYSNKDNNRREMERDDCDKWKEKGRYYRDSNDSDDYYKKDANRSKEYSNDKSDEKSSKKSDRMEASRSKYYENERDYERSKRTQKNYHQQDESNSHNKSGGQDKQTNDDGCSRRDTRYVQETGYQSDYEKSDYDERRQHVNKNTNELEDDGSKSNRKEKHHVRKTKDWSSDDGGNDHDNRNDRRDSKKMKHYQDDESSTERRKDKKSLQKSGIFQHDSDDHCIINERQQLEKNKRQQKDDAAATDYVAKGLEKGSHQCDIENYYDKRQMEKSGLQDDNNGRSYSRQKNNKKSVQENKEQNDSENSLKDGIKPRQDKCRWDSDQDERDSRRKSQKKYQKNNGDEYDRRGEVEKHSNSGRSNSQKFLKRDVKGNKNEKKKSDIREKDVPSEIVLREEAVKHKSGRDNSRKEKENESEQQNREREESTKSAKKQNMDILTRTGGAYIPPAKLRAMQQKITDKSSINYQRIAWEALKKSINGLINKVNVSNLEIIIKELFKENLVRAKGILARAIMQAQAASPTFTHVYAALVAIINTKFPHIGELIIKRLIIQFRRSFRRNDKQVCLACTNFVAHLVNQQAAHEVLALEILTLLLENPTDDSVELAVGFLKECGLRLSEATRSGTDAVFERLRTVLHDGEVDKRVQYMIEVMFAVRKDKFKDHPTVIEDLDLVKEEDQFTHLITLEDTVNPEDILNVFRFDSEYEANEAKYEEIKKALLQSSDSEEENSDDDSNNDNEEDDENGIETQTIIDSTETNLTSLRRTIYLTIQSSLDFEECAHKLLKLELKPGQIVELCYMILDCCAQQRTYEKFFGLLAQRFCQINKIYVEPFEDIFKTAYDTIHRFETNKLRNVARFFAHLFYTDAISWQILSHIKLNEDETTSSSRIFVKILFQELCEYMGLLKLNERVKDPTMQEAFEGLFPRDSPRNTRFAINFFTSIGLGGLTDELREHLKTAPKATVFPSAIPLTASNDDNPNSSEEETSKVADSPSVDSSSSEEEPRIKKSKRSKRKKKKTRNKESKKRREKTGK